jgi:hypothetical protein
MRFQANSHPKKFEWNWGAKGFNRISVVNHLISVSGGLSAKYLEIGCGLNALFDSVSCMHKTGVDPNRGGTHRMTSDEFFLINSQIYDVIFIDGLHEYEQVHRDAVNALNSINVGGYVAIHDLLPSDWKEHHVPRISDVWTGDCWKLAVQLTAVEGIEFVILDLDHGVGVLKKISENCIMPKISDDLIVAHFDNFVRVVDELPILPFEEGLKKVVSS